MSLQYGGFRNSKVLRRDRDRGKDRDGVGVERGKEERMESNTDDVFPCWTLLHCQPKKIQQVGGLVGVVQTLRTYRETV